MKQQLFFVGVIAFIMSCIACNNNSGSSASMASDSIVAANAAKDSILAKNKATALAAVKTLSLQTIDQAFKDVTPDAIDYGDGSGKPIKGVDSIKAAVKSFLTAFPDMKGENYTVIGDGNVVAVFGEYTATFKAPLMGIKPTGKKFTKVRDVDVFTFNDAGKITEHRSIQAPITYLSEVGAQMKK
ncbi:MAG TPA: ester cyclase [Puia sp.]|nr:ester cyclase [Puia sp.]